jgi:hypothetical protein
MPFWEKIRTCDKSGEWGGREEIGIEGLKGLGQLVAVELARLDGGGLTQF